MIESTPRMLAYRAVLEIVAANDIDADGPTGTALRDLVLDPLWRAMSQDERDAL